MGKKFTYEEVKKKFEDRGYDLLSTEYINCNEKLDYICKKHKNKGIQKISYTKFYNSGQGCYYCGREKTEKAHRTPLDVEDDKKLCEKKGFIYISSKKENGIYHIDFICNNHKQFGIQTMRKNNMKRDIKGCQYCSNKNLPEWYVMEEKEKINPHIKIIGKYKNLTSSIECFCETHRSRYKTTMQNLLKGHGCYYCGLEKLSKQAFLSEEVVLKNVHKINSMSI